MHCELREQFLLSRNGRKITYQRTLRRLIKELLDGSGIPSSPRPIGFVQTIRLRNEIIEYRHGIFDPVATEAVDRLFRAVIEQLQPKQWQAVKIDLRSPKHADLVAPNRGEQNRR